MKTADTSEHKLLQGYMTGPGIFETVPSAPVAIVFVIGASASIEHQWASILASLSGTEIDTAMLLLEHLRTASAQERAIVQLAQSKLDKEDADIVRIAAAAVLPHRQRRNEFAHGLWAKPIHHEDQLVLLRSAHVKRLNASIAEYLLHGTYRDDEFGTKAEARDFYRAEDFAAAIAEAAHAQELMQQVAYLVMTVRATLSGQRPVASDASAIRTSINSNPAFAAARRKSRSVAI